MPIDPGSGGEGSGGIPGTIGSTNALAGVGIMRAPQITRTTGGKLLNIGRVSNRIVLSCIDLDVCNATITNASAAVFQSATLQHQVSADGFTFYPITGATDVTLPSGTANLIVTANIATQGWRWYALVVTSAASVDQWTRVVLTGKSNT